MNLTNSFKLAEFSQETPPPQVIQNLYMLCVLALEPMRDRFGTVKITSGWRSPERNSKVGGVSTSQHLTGEAADIYCEHAQSMGLVYRFILDELHWKGECLFYRRKGHIHLALPRWNVAADQKILEV